MPGGKATLLFDGVCNLCNAAVRFLLKQDRHGTLSYAWLQSETGQSLARRYGVDPARENSFVLIYNGQAYTRSDAVLQVGRLLGGAWKMLTGFRALPKRWRDAVYT